MADILIDSCDKAGIIPNANILEDNTSLKRLLKRKREEYYRKAIYI